MDLHLAGKIAIVTGASRGIGRAIAENLASEGMHLVLAARSGDLLEGLAASLPTDSLVQTVDLREPEAPAGLIEAAVGHFGRLDLLVNSAGATKRGDFLTLTDQEWLDGFALKFFGAMRCCRAVWPICRISATSKPSLVPLTPLSTNSRATSMRLDFVYRLMTSRWRVNPSPLACPSPEVLR